MDFLILTNEDSLILFIFIAGFVLAQIYAAYLKYRRKYISTTLPNSPILLGYYTYDSKVEPLTNVKRDKYSYTAYFTYSDTTKTSNTILIEVRLPFKTNLHLLGITKRKDMVQIRTDAGSSLMEKVHLEGDYGDHFTLFTDKGMQSQARYILDPKAMAYTIDFCKSHSWEIINSEFYFVQERVPNLKEDPTFMIDDVERFIEEIRPALEIPLSKKDRVRRRPYGSTVKPWKLLQCPVCSESLDETHDEFYECSKGHGTLLHGSDLLGLRKGQIKRKYSSTKTKNTEKVIKCPSCNNKMKKLNYAGSKTSIDSCPFCAFRWLDGGEVKKGITDISMSTFESHV